MNSFSDWAKDARLKGLVLAVLLLAALALGAYTYFTLKQSKYIYMGPTTISVRGVGEVARVPDVAMFTFGVRAEAVDPAAAQSESAESMNTIVAYLKENGIAETDIKTVNYSLSPRYEYSQAICTGGFCPPGRQELVGYTVDQMIEVKVRDTAKAGSLIAGVGERGATNVGSLQFTIDDDTEVKAEARKKAVEQAKQKAEELAETLDVKLVRMTGFWEEEGGGYPMYDRGYGGAAMESAMVAPAVPTGENTVNVVVNLTYEIR